VVERMCVATGRVGGRKGVGVGWGAQAEAKIKANRTANKFGRGQMRSIS
jgi:hypothetical protein